MHTVVDPEAKDEGDLKHNLEHADHATADLGWRTFRNVDGNNHRGTTDGQARQGTTSVQHSKVTNELDNHAHNEDQAEHNDDELATETFSQKEAEDGAEKGAGLEGRDNVGREVSGGSGGQTEGGLEGGETERASDESRVVAVHGGRLCLLAFPLHFGMEWIYTPR